MSTSKFSVYVVVLMVYMAAVLRVHGYEKHAGVVCMGETLPNGVHRIGRAQCQQLCDTRQDCGSYLILRGLGAILLGRCILKRKCDEKRCFKSPENDSYCGTSGVVNVTSPILIGAYSIAGVITLVTFLYCCCRCLEKGKKGGAARKKPDASMKSTSVKKTVSSPSLSSVLSSVSSLSSSSAAVQGYKKQLETECSGRSLYPHIKIHISRKACEDGYDAELEFGTLIVLSGLAGIKRGTCVLMESCYYDDCNPAPVTDTYCAKYEEKPLQIEVIAVGIGVGVIVLLGIIGGACYCLINYCSNKDDDSTIGQKPTRSLSKKSKSKSIAVVEEA